MSLLEVQDVVYGAGSDKRAHILAGLSLTRALRSGLIFPNAENIRHIMDAVVDIGENTVVELVARVFGHADDNIVIQEKVALNGDNARGLIKARVAIEDEVTAEIRGITEGNAAGARGHVDCMEIVKDRAVAKAYPRILSR